MAGERTGRVPVMCQMSVGHLLVRTGASPAELWFDRGRFVDALLTMRERYAFDGVLVSLHGHPADWSRRVLRWRRGEGEDIIDWRGGGRTFFPHDDLPRPGPEHEFRPPEIVDFDPDRLPERISYIPVSPGLRFSIDPDRPYGALEDVLAGCGGRFSVHGEVTSPFDYFLDLFGFVGGFLALADEPERSRAILERLSGGVARIAAEQAALGIDAVKISSPYAGAGFISPRHYRDFVLPGERRVAAAVHEAGALAYTHTCGAIGDRLEMMADSGVDGLECLDPPPLGDVELEDALGRLRGLFIKGNIDPVNTLLFGTPEQVSTDVRRRLAAGGARGGYILSTACSIAPHTPPDRIELLAALAEECAAGD
jgi:hypothetical protein